MNYVVKDMQEVFSDQFAEYIRSKQDEAKYTMHGLDQSDVQLIFRRITEFESKHDLQYVTHFNQFLIFRQL